MLTVKDIYAYIDEFAPFCGQCEWDNSGLLVGSGDAPVSKIGVVLDITPEAVESAVSDGIDLIVSHHPVIFSPLARLNGGSPAYMLARNGIAAICAHTSLDAARGGVNDVLAELLGFRGAVAVTAEGEEKALRVCELGSATTAAQLAQRVKNGLKTQVILCEGAKEIKKIALCGGAGGDFIDFVIKNGCDAYITGEVKYHEMLEAKQGGLTVVAAGHFETENPVVEAVAQRLGARLDVPVAVIAQSRAQIIV